MDTSLLGNNQPVSSKRKYIIISAIALCAVVGVFACVGFISPEEPIVQENISKHILTFKNPQCVEQHLELFQEEKDYKYLKSIGVLILNKNKEELDSFLNENQEFNDCVKSTEADQTIVINDPVQQKKVDKKFERWHLKRISTRKLPLGGIKKFESKQESHVYIIDSGIDARHSQLQMYISQNSYDHKGFVKDICCETSYDPLCDCDEHGTHCAGLVASEVAGYNQFTTLHSGKVFSWSGSTTLSIILDAMNWALVTHQTYHSGTVGVVSMSLGGPKSTAEEQAVKALHDSGLFVVVAAGNENEDACQSSPSCSPYAFTVGASYIDDTRSSWSNYGSCVDTFAPGENIYSTVPGNKFDYLSGTSMACPLVAGLASSIATEYGTADPATIKSVLQCLFTQDIVTKAKSDNNMLPYDNLAEFNPKNPWCKIAIENLQKQ